MANRKKSAAKSQHVASDNLAPDLTHAEQLLDAGMKLVPLRHNEKRPLLDAWNQPAHFAGRIDPSATGYGMPLAANGLASIDPDNAEPARQLLAFAGFDLEALMSAGVRVISTRPGSGGRSTFRDPGDLRWIKFSTVEHGTILELRAHSANLQDVVPGLVYADKAGELRTQTYANGRTFLDAPDLPPDLLDWWRRLSTDIEFCVAEQRRLYAALGATGHYTLSVGKALAFQSELRTPFNQTVAVEEVLERNGFRESGRRWTYEGASGAPGIRPIPGTDGLWQSDHAGCGLHGTFDSWTACVALEHGGDVRVAEAAFRAEYPEQALTTGEALRRGAAKSREAARQRLAGATERAQETRKAAPVVQDPPAVLAAAPAEPEVGSDAWIETHPTLAIMPSDFRAKRPPIPQSVVEHWLPRQVVTLFGAHGGEGKSFVALEVAVRVALGLPVFGCRTERVPVLVYSCEDSEAVMRDRADRLAEHFRHRPEDLDDWLFLFDMTAQPEVELFVGGKQGAYATELSTRLHNSMLLYGAGLLVVDNASDVFAANENARAEVRTFMRDQMGNTRKGDYAELLLAHVNKPTAGAKAGEDVQGYSGSTAWHNSARSRWFMAPMEGSPDTRILTLDKANYGRKGLAVEVRWDDQSKLLLTGAAAKRESLDNLTGLILAKLVEYADKGIELSASLHGTGTAHSALRKDLREMQGHKPKAIQEELEKLYRQEYLKKTDRPVANSNSGRKVTRFEVTDKARAALGEAARMRAKVTGTEGPGEGEGQ